MLQLVLDDEPEREAVRAQRVVGVEVDLVEHGERSLAHAGRVVASAPGVEQVELAPLGARMAERVVDVVEAPLGLDRHRRRDARSRAPRSTRCVRGPRRAGSAGASIWRSRTASSSGASRSSVYRRASSSAAATAARSSVASPALPFFSCGAHGSRLVRATARALHDSFHLAT